MGKAAERQLWEKGQFVLRTSDFDPTCMGMVVVDNVLY